MELDDSLTPRTGRKKKSSTLSKLAARGRRKIEDDDDSDAKSPSASWDQNQQKYPIDANVEIRNTSTVVGDDSDEGIEVTADSLSHGFNNSYLGPSAAINNNGDQEWGHNSNTSHYSSSKFLGRDHEESSLRPNDLENKRLSERASPFGSDPEELHESNRIDRGDEPNHLLHVREVLDSEKVNHVGQAHTGLFRNKDISDELENAASGPFRSNLISAARSRSSEDLTDKYKKMISDQDQENGGEEEEEMSDNVSALRQMGPKTSMQNNVRSATTTSLYSSQERTWGSLNKFGGFDTLSQRSYQSTSVLPLITTKEARDRSFLVGSMSGRAALMGLEEMERFFPDHKIRIFTGTWNMCDMKLLPSSLDDWLLPDTSDYIQDMYVIGTQESCTNKKEWEIRLQETLGPSHVLFHTATHGVLYLCVFLRRDLIWFCSVTEEDTVTTRLGPSNIATKGAVGTCFTFFGTSFLFVDTHLTPHDGKVKERISDYNKIISGLNLPQIVISNPYSLTQGIKKPSPTSSKKKRHRGGLEPKVPKEDVTARFDCVFWMGDLNFRLEKERERLDNAMQGAESYEDLMRHDELFRVRNEGLAFQEFQEGRIKFKPTYKYDRGTDDFDTSKKLRIPSYTDRILFRSKRKNAITCLFYDSVPVMKDSDHKPVYAMFEVAIRPGKDSIPLAAGQFNREIWLEGNRRRAERLEKQKFKSKTSSVCSIQ